MKISLIAFNITHIYIIDSKKILITFPIHEGNSSTYHRRIDEKNYNSCDEILQQHPAQAIRND